MKKFILTILSVTLVFIGLGGLIDRAGAKFKSDERALQIIVQARQAIGGDAAIGSVKSMSVNARVAKTLNIDGVSRTEDGDLEINLQLPNRFSQKLKIGKAAQGEETGAVKTADRVVIISRVEAKSSDDQEVTTTVKPHIMLATKDENGKIVVSEKAADGNQETANGQIFVRKTGESAFPNFRQNEMFRTTFALLLSAPEGTDASYTYAGESSVDGNSCDVVLAQNGESSFKLFIDKSSHLPLMMSYQGVMPIIMKFRKDELKKANAGSETIVNGTDGQNKGDGKKVIVFTHKLDAPPATAEFQVKFSDYRSINGVQLPYKWTQTANGQPDQNVDVTSYEINPANIADKFAQEDQKVFVRTAKPQ